MAHGGKRTGSEPAYPLQHTLSGHCDHCLPCYAIGVVKRERINSDHVVMCSKCLRFNLNDGFKQCKGGTGCNRSAGKSGGKGNPDPESSVAWW